MPAANNIPSFLPNPLLEPNPLLQYLGTPVDQDQPIAPLQQATAQQGQLKPLGGQAKSPLAEYQPNPIRQQREQSLMQGIQHLTNRPPAQGFFGKAGRILEGVGNAAGTIFLGNNNMAAIPGTEQNRALRAQSGIGELHNLEGEDRADQGQFYKGQQEQAATEHMRAVTAAMPAEAQERQRLQDAQIQNLLHPQAKTDFEAWRQQHPDAPVEDWLKAQAASKNQKPDTPEQQFIDEFTKTHPNGTIADAVHAYAAATQKPERGPTIVQQNSEVDRIASRLAKPYDEGYKQGGNTLSRIQQTMHSVDAGYVGQGLAIPELLTALVSGQGTGVRITQPELNAITAARGIKGDAESWFNSLAGKGKLTDSDKQQIKTVLSEARRRIEAKTKIHSDALDAINGAESRADVVKADKESRQKLNDLEKYGHYAGETITLKDGTQKTILAIHPDGSFDAN